MGLSTPLMTIHDDTLHTGSAKRDTALGVAGLDSSGNVLALSSQIILTRDVGNNVHIKERTSNEFCLIINRASSNDYSASIYEGAVWKRIQTESMKNVASGIAGLDALKALQPPRTHNNVGSIGNNYTAYNGIWVPVNYASQTDWDDALVSQPGLLDEVSGVQGISIDWNPIVLMAGTYVIKIVTMKGTYRGIMEVLHGATSLGTYDCYAAATAYNQIATFNYSPTTSVSAPLRIQSTTKNAASTNYDIGFSRIEIFKTA